MSPSPTTEFDHLMKAAFVALYPKGSATAHFTAQRGGGRYARGVKPDFVLPDSRWLDFKLHVSYREKHDVAWRPSALYASLRKYIDHPANVPATLGVVYRHRHGTIADVIFPIMRGRTVLISDATEFKRRIVLVNVEKLFKRIEATSAAWVVSRIRRL